jgi:thymidylate synthase (FAD)
MNVKLISITQPLIKTKEDDRNLSPEELISFCARVSNPNNQLNVETAPKLLKYCLDHGHVSIFEMAGFCVEIKTSRAIAAQILRHRSFSFQEFSQRYAEVQEFELIELRKQGKTNRQVGDEVLSNEYLDREIDSTISRCLDTYKLLIESGVAKETARFVLPLNTQTTLFMNGNIRSWIFYIKLRTAIDTQKEHRLVAEEIKKIFIDNFPNISETLGWKT